MTTSFFKQIRKKGYLLVGYAYLKKFGIIPTLVLERLLTEYNFAIRNKSYLQDYFFAIDVKEIAMCLCISETDVNESIKILKKSYLIYTTEVENFFLVHINEKSFLSREEEIEKDNSYNNWDFGLLNIQFNAFSHFMFSKEGIDTITTEIKKDDGYAKDENGNRLVY